MGPCKNFEQRNHMSLLCSLNDLSKQSRTDYFEYIFNSDCILTKNCLLIVVMVTDLDSFLGFHQVLASQLQLKHKNKTGLIHVDAQ